MLIAGIDPGSRNFAITVIDDNKKVIKTTLIQNAIRNLTNTPTKKEPLIFRQQVSRFLKEIRPYLIDLDYLLIERFQGRGLRGSQGEMVSVMIGLLVADCRKHKIKYTLLTASQWKNHFNRLYKEYNLNDLYETAKAYKLKPHTIDSFLIACYYNKDFGDILSRRRNILKCLSANI